MTIVSLDDTPLDFRDPNLIGSRIDIDNAQLILGSGYDHNYVLRGNYSHLKKAARVIEPISGRVMEQVN